MRVVWKSLSTQSAYQDMSYPCNQELPVWERNAERKRKNDRIQKGWDRQMMIIFLELANIRVTEIFYSPYQGLNTKVSCKKQPRIFSSLCSCSWQRELEAMLLIRLYLLKLSAASTDGVRKPCSRSKEASALELKSISPIEEVQRLIERWKKVIEAMLV